MYAGLSVSRRPSPCIESSSILEVNYILLKKRPAKLIMILPILSEYTHAVMYINNTVCNGQLNNIAIKTFLLQQYWNYYCGFVLHYKLPLILNMCTRIIGTFFGKHR